MLTEQLKQLKNQDNQAIYITGDLFKKITDKDLQDFKKAGFVTVMKRIENVSTIMVYLDKSLYNETFRTV